MLFPKETILTDHSIRPTKVVVRHVGEGLTLISILLRTDTGHTSSFSIAVTLFDGNSANNDARMIEDVTADTDEAEKLFRLITEGAVTPCTLSDVLEDLL